MSQTAVAEPVHSIGQSITGLGGPAGLFPHIDDGKQVAHDKYPEQIYAAVYEHATCALTTTRVTARTAFEAMLAPIKTQFPEGSLVVQARFRMNDGTISQRGEVPNMYAAAAALSHPALHEISMTMGNLDIAWERGDEDGSKTDCLNRVAIFHQLTGEFDGAVTNSELAAVVDSMFDLSTPNVWSKKADLIDLIQTHVPGFALVVPDEGIAQAII